jgi:hypothetical protein
VHDDQRRHSKRLTCKTLSQSVFRHRQSLYHRCGQIWQELQARWRQGLR